MGFLSLDPLKLRILLKTGTEAEKKAVKRIVPILTDHHRILATLLLFNTVANESLPVFLDALVPSWLSVLLAVTAIFFFCELLPNAIFTGPYKLTLAARCVPFMRVLMFIFYPLAVPLAKLMDWVLTPDDGDDDVLAKGDGQEDDIAFSAGELTAMIDIVKDAAIQQGILKSELEQNMRDEQLRSSVSNPMQGTDNHSNSGIANKLAKDLVVHRHAPGHKPPAFGRVDSTADTNPAEMDDLLGSLPQRQQLADSVNNEAFLKNTQTASTYKIKRYYNEKEYAQLEAEVERENQGTVSGSPVDSHDNVYELMMLMLRLSVGNMKRGMVTPLKHVDPAKDTFFRELPITPASDKGEMGYAYVIPSDTLLDFTLLECLSSPDNVFGGYALVHRAGKPNCFMGCVSVQDVISFMAIHQRSARAAPAENAGTSNMLTRTLSTPGGAQPMPTGSSTGLQRTKSLGGDRARALSVNQSAIPTVADIPLLQPLIVDQSCTLLNALRKHQQWLLYGADKDANNNSILGQSMGGSISGTGLGLNDRTINPNHCDLVLISPDAAQLENALATGKNCPTEALPVGAMTLSDLLQSADLKRARVARRLGRRRRHKASRTWNARLSESSHENRASRASLASEDVLDDEHDTDHDVDDEDMMRQSENVLEYIRQSYSVKKENMEISRSLPTAAGRGESHLGALLRASGSGAAGYPQTSSAIPMPIPGGQDGNGRQSMSGSMREYDDLHSTSLSKSGLTIDHLDDLKLSISLGNNRGSLAARRQSATVSQLPTSQNTAQSLDDHGADSLTRPILSPQDRLPK